jgi:cell fate regulator YaaT (PSP1 superfamily)
MTLYRVGGVRFQRRGRVVFADPRDLDLQVDDRVVVATEGGPRVGTVVIAPRQVVHSDVKGPLPPVLGRMPEGQSP